MTQPIDWPKLLGDLEYLGMTGKELARAAHVPRDAIKRWSQGVVPSRHFADRLQLLWCHMTGKPDAFLPRRPAGTMPMRAEVPNLDSDEDQEPAYVQIDALHQVWGRIFEGNH